ncbi:MAG: adenosylcobinamide-GDP ribazoletransferase [Candidatus Omnitrophica bacterium]|nr:adenosylcobinamide-GDP ribazoletransferase [Candidatus Omnitrophota bacterium]MDD5574021.1 adenosylcobinamide-GDP ribazoletransferase [Candidatus Omnitrophota bacterium]
MTNFLLALQFLTIIPVRVRHFNEDRMAPSAVFFPLVGCLLGAFLAVLYNASLWCGFSSLTTSALCVIALIVLTGGMHGDGLADTFDALGSCKDRSRMLDIMREPTIGTMGATGLICAIVLKIVLLSDIPQQDAPAALIFMTTFSRWAMVFVMTVFPYARKEGKASAFSKGISGRLCALATALALLPAVILGPSQGIPIFLLAGSFSYLCAKAVRRIIRGYTGDTLGATSEITEIFVLGCVLIAERAL